MLQLKAQRNIQQKAEKKGFVTKTELYRKVIIVSCVCMGEENWVYEAKKVVYNRIGVVETGPRKGEADGVDLECGRRIQHRLEASSDKRVKMVVAHYDYNKPLKIE